MKILSNGLRKLYLLVMLIGRLGLGLGLDQNKIVRETKSRKWARPRPGLADLAGLLTSVIIFL
jgi:hypothetical protein